MKNYFFIVAILFAFSPPAKSNAGDCCRQPIVCPRCKTHCKLTIEQVKEKKHYYEVECVPICIPKVRFPWQKCGPPKCAKTKMVYRLKKIKYTCDKCKYVWTPVCSDCGACASGPALSGPALSGPALDDNAPLPPLSAGAHHAPRTPTDAKTAAPKSLVGISLFAPRIR